MHRLWKVGLLGIITLVICLGIFSDMLVMSLSWKGIRNEQPPALHLKMTLTRDHFFQGEKIDASLEFFNDDDAKPYTLTVGAGAPGAVFHAEDDKGVPVVNPFQWRDDWYGLVVMGPVAMHSLGRYALTLPVNDTVRFDRPGVYQLYAQAYVVTGDSVMSGPRAEMVSDPIKITILPLTPEKENAIMAEALKKIATHSETNSDVAQEGMKELGALQTPAACDALIAHLGDPELAWDAREGLLAAPDPVAEADRLLKAVEAGKLVLNDDGAELYGELKTSSLIRGISTRSLPEKEAQRRFDELWKARVEAKQEVLTAQLDASGDHGPAYIEALWTAFQDAAIHKNPGEQDPDGGKARRAMAAHQLELPEKHVQELLSAWSYWGSADFLPLVRREATPLANNQVALIALAGIQPVEALPRIMEDLKQPNSRFLQGSYPASTLLPTIAPMPLPQLDGILRDKLTAAKGNAFPIIPVIGCFGSANLLPGVVEAYRQYAHDPKTHWDDAILVCFFRYWLRCDQEKGATALVAEIQARGKEGPALLLSVLRNPWTEDGLPVVNWALKSSSMNLVSQVVILLEKHGDDSSIEPVITALGRFRGSKEEIEFSSRWAVQLLKSDRWHYSEEQRKRLNALAAVKSK